MTTTPAKNAKNLSTVVLELEDPNCVRSLFGAQQVNLAALRKGLPVSIQARDNRLVLKADDQDALSWARVVVQQLYEVAEAGFHLVPSDVERAIRILQNNPKVRLADIYLDTVLLTNRSKPIGPKGPAQKAYVDAMRRLDIVFGVGPAGTGKTYLAMAMALDALNKKLVRRIILTRPAVEAGEKLGFLPGDLAEKVNPYLRPLNDALNDMVDPERAASMLQSDRIEVAPLAFMRGRTLNDSFVILDEAQNTTREQMKMFLTRLGFDTKAVITGDVTQIDLPNSRNSGLIQAITILKEIEGIGICRFTEMDVVRHPLVMKIIQAYDRVEQTSNS